MADSARHMALEPQPDERLDELVGPEQHGDPGQRDELAALADMADGVDADRADQHAAADVSLRREAHAGVQPARGWRRGGPSPGRRCRVLLTFRLVRGSVPSTKARARSDRRRLLVRARSRSTLNAWSVSTPSRSASLPLACSMITRLFSAVCSCSFSVSLCRMLRSCSKLIVATSASAWPTRISAGAKVPGPARNRFSAPMTC